jgi:hypothetical protein
VDRLGGDPTQIVVLEAVRDTNGKRPLDLARDIAVLNDAIHSLRPELLIIDPITAYLGRTDAYRDAEVRGMLVPLIAGLEELHAALLAIAHLTKDQTRQALHRPGGSVAFVAAARLAFCLAPAPHDPDLRVLAPLKTNLCQRPEPLAFRLDGDRLLWEIGSATGLDADTLLRAVSPEDHQDRTDAEQVITELLQNEADWPLPAQQALNAGQAHGISERTMRRAAHRLGVQIKKATGFGSGGGWLWYRPAIADTFSGHPTHAVSSMAPMAEQARTPSLSLIEDIKSANGGDDGQLI